MSKREIRTTLRRLISENKVVTLRGYASIYDFTIQNKELIHQVLQWWQGLEAGNAIAGLQGHPVVLPQQLEFLMRELYHEVETQQTIAYQMLQYPGLTAHAWLVQKVMPIYENLVWQGFELHVIDSNYPLQTLKFTYRRGQTHFMGDFGPFTPYSQWRGSIKRYRTALQKHCQPKRKTLATSGDKDSTLAHLEK